MEWLRNKIIKWLRVDRDIYYVSNCTFFREKPDELTMKQVGEVVKNNIRKKK